MTNVQIVIPFRSRGLDPRREANLEIVMAWWWAHGFTPRVQSDGLKDGDSRQFNRHRSYNLAVSGNPDADVFVFSEADMLIHPDQINLAVRLAARRVGLVVPFTQYRYLSDEMTTALREDFADRDPGWLAENMMGGWPFDLTPESVMDNGKSIGAVNVVSRETLKLTGGFTEATEGNWYDDNIIEEGFRFLTGNNTSFVPGPAVHLYHLPGHSGDHLTDADKRATQRNRDTLVRMRAAIRMNDREHVTRLMSYREGAKR